MTQQPDTRMLMGGLDLVSPALALAPGLCVAALNYESDDAGYGRVAGYERYDGQPAPSQATGVDGDTAAARRALIQAVPGVGPVRGVWAYGGFIWAFRDTEAGTGGMYRADPTGWTQVTFTEEVLSFEDGATQFLEGEVVTGTTSLATARIHREVTRTGAYDGSATGYLVIYDASGPFTPGEAITSTSGAAVVTSSETITLEAGGAYQFVNHNFYASEYFQRMYFLNGSQNAFEWDGTRIAPIFANVIGGPATLAFDILGDNDLPILGDNGLSIINDAGFDRPIYLAVYADRLALAFRGGALQLSSLGEPCEFRAITGAVEIGTGNEITGLVDNANTALIVFCRSQIHYLQGSGPDDFVFRPISSAAGAFPRSAQMLDAPFYLDDGGIRKLNPTQAFGDWKLGTISERISPLLRRKRRAGVTVAASVQVREKAHYRLYFDDGTGLSVFVGRKYPECMPFKYPISITCACSGEIDVVEGRERVFAGGNDGFVYELESGNSFDGGSVPAYLTVAWNHVGMPQVEKRFFSASFDVDAPDPFSCGISFQVGYNRAAYVQGNEQTFDADAGTRDVDTVDSYDNVLWTEPVSTSIDVPIDGAGPNVAITIVSDLVDEAPHTLSTITINYSARKLIRR